MRMNAMDQNILNVKTFLIYCAQAHPKAQVQDYIKRIRQSEFGTDRDLSDPEENLRLLREEIDCMTDKMLRRPWFDPFFGPFCRMNLSVSQVISPELIYRIQKVSNQHIPKTAWVRFEEKLRIFGELCQEMPSVFRFSAEEALAYLERYRQEQYPPVAHSEIYLKNYEPCYRVIKKEYGRYVSLYAAIEKCLKEKGTVNVAIDGNSSAGKTEAAQVLSKLWDSNVFHADDFFLPLEKRTPQRLEEVGGNMERERFREEICENVKRGKPFSYRPFDCSVMKQKEPVLVQPKPVNIFEGSYCMHPDLQEYYDVKVFLSVSPAEQEARILARNGDILLRRYLEEWIPKENAYFEAMHIREACDIVYESGSSGHSKDKESFLF